MNNGNSTPPERRRSHQHIESSAWAIQIADEDSEDGLLAEVLSDPRNGSVQVAVFMLDPFPSDEMEPMIVLVDASIPRYNAFWRKSSTPHGLDPETMDFEAGIAQLVAFTVMSVQDKYGVG